MAERIGYPVLVRPSYVLGGRAMQICYREESLRDYMVRALAQSPGRPILIDQFLVNAYEFDVDAVSDGEHVVIGGVMQHIEEAGVHSGDSSCVLPPYNITNEQFTEIVETTRKLARALNVVGLMNMQFALQKDKLYVLEVNPRASRTVPFVSKARGVSLAQIATHIKLGAKLADMQLRDMTLSNDRVAIKESVFPFNKFRKSSIFLGPEMHSTGEVMGIDSHFGSALIKAHISSGNALPLSGTVFISLCDRDKTQKAVQIAKGYAEMGFDLWATRGTSSFLQEHGLSVRPILKHWEGRPSIIDYIKQHEVSIIINTPTGENSRHDEMLMGRAAMDYKIPFFTTLAAAWASISGIAVQRQSKITIKSLQEYYAG